MYAVHLGFPGGSVVKNPSANAEDLSLIPELGRAPGVVFCCLAVSDSLWPHKAHQVSLSFTRSWRRCPLNQWCHPTISCSVVPFSSCLQSFPASRSFPMNRFFASGGQSIGASVSVSVLPMNIQGWFPLGLTGLISLPSKGLLRDFSSTTVRKHGFFSI